MPVKCSGGFLVQRNKWWQNTGTAGRGMPKFCFAFRLKAPAFIHGVGQRAGQTGEGERQVGPLALVIRIGAGLLRGLVCRSKLPGAPARVLAVFLPRLYPSLDGRPLPCWTQHVDALTFRGALPME